MSRRYSVSGSDTNTASTTQLGITSTAAIRPKIYDVLISSAATPADQAAEYFIQRYTAAGTSTGVTPQSLDPGDPSATATAGVNHSVEPTYSSNAIMLRFAVNQRATFRWVAAPGGEIILPATAANGVGLFTNQVSSAFSIAALLHYEE